MLLKQPTTGLPGEDPNQYFIARVPIYGTVDAGRKFWKKLKTELTKLGLRENSVMPALYSLTDESGKITLMVATHVDDIIWVDTPETEWIMKKLSETFQCGEPETRDFRYCGKEIVQKDDFSIDVTCKSTTLKLKPVHIRHGRKAGMELDESERSQIRSIAGSLAWIARQCRPDLAYHVSYFQSLKTKGKVSDLKALNKVIEFAKSTADQAISFQTGILDWDEELTLCTITDASFANEQETIEDLFLSLIHI